MARLRVGTFNCDNLFLRYAFSGPMIRNKKGESDASYEPGERKSAPKPCQTLRKSGDPIGWLSKNLDNFDGISHTQRQATAAVISANNPGIMALTEIESLDALRKFNSSKYFGAAAFKHALLIDAYDPHGINVAVRSNFEIINLRTHMDDTYTDGNKTPRVFSRDCLEVTFKVNGAPLTLYVNYLKSQARDDPAKRTRQARRGNTRLADLRIWRGKVRRGRQADAAAHQDSSLSRGISQPCVWHQWPCRQSSLHSPPKHRIQGVWLYEGRARNPRPSCAPNRLKGTSKNYRGIYSAMIIW